MKNGAYKACELLTVFRGNQTCVVAVADPSLPRLAGHREVRIWPPERGLDTAQIVRATALATRDLSHTLSTRSCRITLRFGGRAHKKQFFNP